MGNNPDAEYHGKYIYDFGDGPLSSSQGDQKIIHTQIWACRLLHGSYSWALTGVANTLTVGTSDPIEHWWLRIQTGPAYYTIQKFSSGKIIMHRNTGAWQANQCGLACSKKANDASRWIQNKCQITSSYKTINWFIKQIEACSYGNYSLFNANCQDFAQSAFDTIVNGSATQKQRYPSAALLGLIPITGTKN